MIEFAVRRPSVVWALSIMLLLAGAVSFTKLPLATRTQVVLPRLQVSASWSGSSAEVMEAYVTAPLEAAVQGVRGVRRVDSNSSDGSASLTINLEPNADVQITRLAILERLELLRTEFPAGVSPPQVQNYVPEALQEQALFTLSVSGPYTPGTLQKLLNERVQPRLSAVPGISSVRVSSGAQLGVSVSYDATLMRRIGMSPNALQDAVNGARIVRSLGIESNGVNTRPVILRDQPRDLDDVMRLPIRGSGLRVFPLGELAAARAEEDTRGSFNRINGRPAISISVYRQPTADAIKTAAKLRTEVIALRKEMPRAVTITIQNDQSTDLADDLRDLARRGAISFFAVLVVLSVLLQRWRAVALIMGSTAVAIAGTALSLYLLNIPANLLTLAGLGMGIGILVQNAIIVVNRLSTVADTPEARAAATSRIMPAVVGSTLTTAVVLFPFLYLQGDARSAFVPFAAAFVMATFWSVFTALFVVPAIGLGSTRRKVEWRRATNVYRWCLQRSLRWRWLTLSVTVAIMAVIGWGFVKKVPRYSWGSGFGGGQRTTLFASLTFPRGSDPGTVDRGIREFEDIVLGRPEVELVQASSGDGKSGRMSVIFTRDGGMTSVPMELEELLTQRAVLIGGASVYVHGDGPGFSAGGGGGSYSSFSIKVLGYSYEGVTKVAEDLKRRLGLIPRVKEVRITATGGYGGSERGYIVALEPDRAALAHAGVTTVDFNSALRREIVGPSGGTKLNIGGDEVSVNIKSSGVRERTMEQLQGAMLRSGSGALVRLGDLATISAREALTQVVREDQQYVRTVSYDFRGPQKLAQRTHDAFMKSISVPSGYKAIDGNFRGGGSGDESEKGLYLVFAMGIALVVIVVALVFDSVWGSGMVFLSLPFALGGVGAAFWAFGAAFTREAAVGVILVVGLAVHQSILLVDAALHKRRASTEHGGTAALHAGQVMQSALDRVSMIILVTLTSLASLAPLSIGTKAGDMFGAIALATAGGTVAGTLAAMFVIPSILVGRRGTPRKKRQKKNKTTKRTPIAATEPIPSV
ncbi:MAG: efflux RND transporter permease subunit [Gemmatimonas sp.]